MEAFTLGLMTTDLPQPRRGQPVTDATWRLLASAGREAGGTVVFFHPHDIDLPQRTVRGFAFDPVRGWASGRWSLPPVIVDNVFIAFARRDKTYAAVKRALSKRGIRILNPRLPDKWGVWQALLARRSLRPHLPETKLLQSGEELEAWLERHDSVFVKPSRGSGGHGIVQVQADGSGAYLLTGAEQARLSPSQLREQAEGWVRREKHLLQRGLSLLEADHRYVDIRVVLHRDGHGDWQAVATVPRIGQPGRAVTNLAQGGETRSLEWLYERADEEGWDVALPSQRRIEDVAIDAAEAVTMIRPTLAVLGIDVALDRAGGLWVLDVNPRPGRKVLTMDDRKVAFHYLVAWARRLMQEGRK